MIPPTIRPLPRRMPAHRFDTLDLLAALAVASMLLVGILALTHP